MVSLRSQAESDLKTFEDYVGGLAEVRECYMMNGEIDFLLKVVARDLWTKFGELGLHGITVEEEFGGSGLGYLEHCVAMEEVSRGSARSEEHTSELQSLMRISYAVFCLKKKQKNQ